MASSGSVSTHLGSGKRRLSEAVVPAAKRQRTESIPESLFFTPLDLLAAILGGMGLVTSPPLPIVCQPFRFLVHVDLSSFGVKLWDIPFDFGWELNRWVFDGELEEAIALGPSELMDRVAGREPESSMSDDDSDDMQITGWELVVYEESMCVDESVIEVASGLPEIEMETQAVPILESETEAESVPKPPVVSETGEETGLAPSVVRETGEGTRAEPIVVSETGEETGPEKIEDPAIQDFSEPFPVFESVDDLSDEFLQKNETPAETPVEEGSSVPGKVMAEGPKKRRIKQLAGKIDLSKISIPKTTPRTVPRPSRKSSRLASRGRPQNPKLPGSTQQKPVLIEDIDTSPETSPIRTPAAPSKAPRPADLQPKIEPTKPSSKTPSSSLGTKRKQASTQEPPAPSSKRTRTHTPPALSAKIAQFAKRTVVRGKVIKELYFQEQGLGVFLAKLRAQNWLDLFANTQHGCSVDALAEFYAHCSVTQGVVTSLVGGRTIEFDAPKLGEILGVPSTGFEAYVREDKTALAPVRLLEIARKLSQNPRLTTPQSIKKGDMLPLHQLLYWFVIKNVIPRGQRRNFADILDQCLVDLLDREEQINLPALMIRHIARMANPSREHDMGYGFLLTLVFEHFKIPLSQKLGAQNFDEVTSTTLMSCGFPMIKSDPTASEPGPRPGVSGPVPSSQLLTALLEGQSQLKSELAEIKVVQSQLTSAFAEVKAAVAAQNELHDKRYDDLIALISDFLAKVFPPSP